VRKIIRQVYVITMVFIGISVYSVNVQALDEPPQLHFVVEKYEIEGDNPLSASKTQAVLNDFLGDHYGLQGLQAASLALEAELREQGFAFYRVSLIPQTLDGGVIKLQITEFTIDKITITGNEHYDEENIMNNLPGLETGKVPNTDVLSRAMTLSNTSPSKSVNLSFSESELGNAIDATVKVNDLDPDFWFTSLNNTGNDETGQWRLTGGYQFTNLFNKDYNLSLSYTLSPSDVQAVKQVGVFFKMPFYESGSEFSVLVARSDVDSGVVAQTFDVSGAGTLVLLRYQKTLLQWGAYEQKFELGFDHKLFENDVTSAGVVVPGDGEVLTRPASVGYIGAWSSVRSSINFSVNYAVNVDGGYKNTDFEYNNLRAGATSDWSSYKYTAAFNYIFNSDWFFRIRGSGQESSDLLISGEQFGIGGIYSVRGFDERYLQGDKGYQGNVELWGPSFTTYAIRPIVFTDFGHTSVNNQQPGLPSSQDISSVGAGLRWSIQNKLNMVLDLGVVTKGDRFQPQISEPGDVKGHFDVFYRF